MVRVPRHLVNIVANYNITDTTILGWKTKYSDTARDYGNTNDAGGNFRDVRLDSYTVHDLSLDFLYGNYKAYVNLTNILDEKYSQAIQYSAPERAFNFGFKKTIPLILGVGFGYTAVSYTHLTLPTKA